MATKINRPLGTTSFLPCLVCGVDSGPVLNFFLWMVGAGLLASLCFLAWALWSGKFQNERSLAQTPLDAEEK